MISVVIPLYNKERSIRSTLSSVLNQTFEEFEVVVVDDGSSDESVAVVKEFLDSRVRLVTQSNQGVSAARNRGIRDARHEWIAFLDGDDLWHEGHLEEIVRMMGDFPSASFYATSFAYSDNRPVYRLPRQAPVFEVQNYFEDAIFEALVCSINVVVKRSCFEVVGYFNEDLRYGEDLDVWARLARKFKLVKSSEVTAVYRVDAENRSDVNRSLEGYFEYHLNLDDFPDPFERKYFERLISSRVYSYLRRGDIVSASRLICKHREFVILFFLFEKLKSTLMTKLK